MKHRGSARPESAPRELRLDELQRLIDNRARIGNRKFIRMLRRANFEEVKVPGGGHRNFVNPKTGKKIGLNGSIKDGSMGPMHMQRLLISLGAMGQETVASMQPLATIATEEQPAQKQELVSKRKTRYRNAPRMSMVSRHTKEKKSGAQKPEQPIPTQVAAAKSHETARPDKSATEELDYGTYLRGLLRDRGLSVSKFERLTGVSRSYPIIANQRTSMLKTLRIGIHMDLPWHEFRMLGDLAGSSRFNSMALYGMARLAKAYGNVAQKKQQTEE